MEVKEFPDEFIRGISSKDFIQNGLVLSSAFQFEDFRRTDNMSEASINWVDDEGAVELALNQKKDNGKLQFSAGVTRLELETVKLFLRSIPPEVFSYERAPLEDNVYHGNLLIDSKVNKQIRQLIMNGLALVAGTHIIPQKCE